MEKSPYINPQEARKNKQKAKKKKKKDTRRSPDEPMANDEREVEIDENKKKKKRRKKTDKPVDTASSDMTEAEADAVRQKLWPTKAAESDKAFNAAKNMNLSAEQAIPAEAEHTAKEFKATKKQKVQFPLEESPLKLKLEHIKKLIVDMSTVKEKHIEISKKIDEWHTKYDGRLHALEASVQSSQKLARSELDDITEGLNELEKLAKRNQQQRNKLKGNLRMYSQSTEAPQSVRAFINQKLINLLCALLLYIAVLRDYMTGKPADDKKTDQQENQNGSPIAAPPVM